MSPGEIDRSEIRSGIDAALARARLAAYDDPDAAQVLGPAAVPEVALHDPGAARIASGEAGPIAARLARIRDRVAEHGFRTWSGSMGAAEARARLVTSAGLDADVIATSWVWNATFDGELGDGFRGRAEEPLQEFDARLWRLASLVSRLGNPAARAPSGLRPVILHPHVVESFVLAILLDNLDGASVAHGESHFRPAQFGSTEPALREDLTMKSRLVLAALPAVAGCPAWRTQPQTAQQLWRSAPRLGDIRQSLDSMTRQPTDIILGRRALDLLRYIIDSADSGESPRRSRTSSTRSTSRARPPFRSRRRFPRRTAACWC